MNVVFKATSRFLHEARLDLARAHPFAAERVAFISIGATKAGDSLVLIAQGYHPVADHDYIDDETVGAMMGQDAIRKALDIALLKSVGVIHVHMHAHKGRPRFSRTDLREQLKFVPDFFKVRHQMPHGALVLSHDSAVGNIWLGPEQILEISEFVSIGPQLQFESVPQGPGYDFSV